MYIAFNLLSAHESAWMLYDSALLTHRVASARIHSVSLYKQANITVFRLPMTEWLQRTQPSFQPTRFESREGLIVFGRNEILFCQTPPAVW